VSAAQLRAGRVGRHDADSQPGLWPLVGVLLSCLFLGYFVELDHGVLSSAGFSPIFALLLAVYDAHAAVLSTLICCAAAFWTNCAPIDGVAARFGRKPMIVIAAFVLAAAALTIFVYHDAPLAMDEYAAVFQSKVFAHGRIAAQLPPYLVKWLIAPGFNGVFLFASPITGNAVEAYWPGFALLLAPFQRLGLPWLCNPLLAGGALYLTHQITLEITADRRTAGFAVLFAIASGAFVANAISFYSMQAHLTANLLYAWLLMSPSRRRAFLAGLVGSLALILHNPVPHALFAIPWLASMAIDRGRRKFLLPLVFGYLPVTIVGGFGWFLYRNGIGDDLHRAASSLSGFASIYRWPDAVMMNARAAGLVKMWVWAAPCLLLFASIGFFRRRRDRNVRLLGWSAICTLAGYMFVVFDQGHGWGYRYFHSAWGSVPILAACAMTGNSAASVRLRSFAGANAILGLALLVPFQLTQMQGFIEWHQAQVPAPIRPGNDVYFVRPAGGFYIGDLIQNDPNLRSKDLILFSHGSQRDAALVHRYWPPATRVAWGPFGEEWNLGPIDQRRRTRADPHLHFVFPAAPVTRSR